MKPDLLYKWWPLGFAKPGIYAYTCAHMQNQMFLYKGTGLEKVVIWAGWGSAGKCVSHILLPISLSRQDFSACFLLEPDTTGWAPCQLFIFLSVLHSPFPPFSSSMHLFYCLPQFPSCNNHYFPFCPYLFFFYFFFTSPLSLVPPLLLARLSFFSLPHFLCALQWFFRFFPSYTLFPCLSLSIQPNTCLAPL